MENLQEAVSEVISLDPDYVLKLAYFARSLNLCSAADYLEAKGKWEMR